MFIQPRHASNHLLFSWSARYLEPYVVHLATIINLCKISHCKKKFICQTSNSAVGIAFFSIALMLILFVVNEEDIMYYIEI